MPGDNKNQQVDAMLIAVRAVVMFFGLSMVILGSHAIRTRHGSVGGYIKDKSQPVITKVEEKMPKVKWDNMSRLFKVERAKETIKIKTDKITPPKDPQ